MAKRGVELIDAGALLVRLAAEYPDELREAHRRGVESRPQTDGQVFEILGRIIGEDRMNTVRAVVTATPESQSDSESAD